MSNVRNTVLTVLMAGISMGSLAQSATKNDPHHPDGPPVTATESRPTPSPKAMRPAQTAGVEKHIKAMQAMHDKMASATTPAQREALMAEHTTLMQEGMGMMTQMGSRVRGMGSMTGGKGMPADRQQLMEQRMEMMESMMQMMMDRLPPAK